MLQGLLTILNRTEVWLGILALTAFLILSWTLRGAPLGQSVAAEDEDAGAPGAAYRDRVVLAIVGGLLLVLAGARLALTGRLLWSLPAFALGFGIVLALIAINHRYRHASPSLRRAIEVANLALAVGLIAGILIVVNVLAFRFGGRPFDFTREGTFTLSSLTTNHLKSLKRPVAFTVFYGDSARSVQQRDRMQQMLELYQGAYPEKVSIAYINPYRELERFEALLKRYPDNGVTQGGGLLIEYGGNAGTTPEHVVIRNTDLFEIARGAPFDETTARFESSFKGEDAVTTALIRLQEGKRPKLVLITGHGEPPTTELDPRKQGLGVFKTRLGALGYEVIELNLVRDTVPNDAEILVVVGPKSAFNGDEVARLKHALDAGKPLLAVLGGPETAEEKSGLEELLRSYNVAIAPTVVMDPRYNYRGRPIMVYAPILPSTRHPIVDSLVNRAALLPRASPIRILTATNAAQANRTYNPAIVPSPILRSGEAAWGETDLTGRTFERNEQEERGPLNVAVAVTERAGTGSEVTAGTGARSDRAREPRPRLVIFSSRFMADNLFLVEEPTNLDVLMNAVNWLRGKAEVGGIAPKTHTVLTLANDPLLRMRLILVPTVMSVLLILGLGITTYMARRE
jgi:ABC-type uncharacterized transport system involved in gliding motility auxiliary subunit